jgi:hypothetical protein
MKKKNKFEVTHNGIALQITDDGHNFGTCYFSEVVPKWRLGDSIDFTIVDLKKMIVLAKNSLKTNKKKDRLEELWLIAANHVANSTN